MGTFDRMLKTAEKEKEKIKAEQDKNEHEKKPNVDNTFNLDINEQTGKESPANTQNINIDEIGFRENNEFDMLLQTDSLEASIKDAKLLHPIILVDNNPELEDESDKKHIITIPNIKTESTGEIKRGYRYTVTSGNRRLQAYINLNKKNPGQYQTIPAYVYVVYDSKESINEKVRNTANVISREDEEKLYKDANLETRQISFTDSIKHAEYLINSIKKDSEVHDKYVKRAIELKEEKAKAEGKKTYKVTYDKENPSVLQRSMVLSSIMTNDYKFPGWSETTARRFISLTDIVNDPTSPHQKAAQEKYEAIKKGEESFKSVDDFLVKNMIKKNSYKKTRANTVKKVNTIVTELDANWSNYTSEEKVVIRKMLKEFCSQHH